MLPTLHRLAAFGLNQSPVIPSFIIIITITIIIIVIIIIIIISQATSNVLKHFLFFISKTQSQV
jgi:hypothetical protein